MVKVDAPSGDPDEAGVFGRLERYALDPERCDRLGDRLELPREGDGCYQQGALRSDGQRLGAPGERPLEGRAGRDGLGQRLPPEKLLGGQQALNLQQCEWVSLRRLPQPLGNLVRSVDPQGTVVRRECNAFGEEVARLEERSATGLGNGPPLAVRIRRGQCSRAMRQPPAISSPGTTMSTSTT